MDPLALKVARRHIAGEEGPRSLADGVIFDADLKDLAPQEAHAWRGYELRLNHATYTVEEWDEGDTANRKQEHLSFVSLEAAVKHLVPYKFESWLDHSTLSGKPKKSGRGGIVQVDAVVDRKDARPLNTEERDFLSTRLKIRG